MVSSKVELPDLNYIINADFPVNLSLYLNRMRMPNIKKFISIFIAEDARHADRLIYVLNECRQPVPSILYKISEAYVNSGKDVDRMPSRKRSQLSFPIFFVVVIIISMFLNEFLSARDKRRPNETSGEAHSEAVATHDQH